MSRPSIREKLARHLTRGVAQEEDVVYLLVEIVKYIERRPNEDRFPVGDYPPLRFFRNWAVHAKLDQGRIDDPLPDWLTAACAEWLDHRHEQRAREAVDAAVAPSRLRDELRRFLADVQLPTALADEERQWVAFLQELTRVLADVPMAFATAERLETFHLTMTEDAELQWVLKARGEDTPLVGRVRWF